MHLKPVFLLSLLLALSAGCMQMPPTLKPMAGQDPAARLLVDEIRRAQPAPYGLPENSTYNYIWAQYMLSMLAAERCGYMGREECLARLQGMLKVILPLERYHGFFYDDYDLQTGNPKRSQIYFQGWWIYNLAILKNAYPELKPVCEKLLAEIDYKNSGLFNPETRELAADYDPEHKRVSFWINLYYGASGEMRTPYLAYTYLTGDISPWTRKEAPRLMDIDGHPAIGVWQNFVFCSMLVHSVVPDIGYFERSWEEILAGLEKYRVRNGMVFFPTRAASLEAMAGKEIKDWPNTEHRIAKTWQSWYGSPDAPVIEKAWIPGFGISIYYDNMNFYWNYGSNTVPCEEMVGTDPEGKRRGGVIKLPFEAMVPATELHAPHPPELTSLTFLASCDQHANKPDQPLQIKLNGQVIATINPEELGEAPTLIKREMKGVVLTQRHNTIDLVNPDEKAGHGYLLYRHESDLWKASFQYAAETGEEFREPIRPPDFEITINGQHEGRENAFALLTRCAVVHHYFPWREMLNDPQFLSNTVVWVGDYYARASVGRVIHNTSDKAVQVQYDRPQEWTDASTIRVVDITDKGNLNVACDAQANIVTWRAEAWHTYRIFGEPSAASRN
ncbi:MAG: hypothetical protein V2A34_15710 [Lentisphaerota bacterium]